MNNIQRVRLFEVALYATVLLMVLCIPFFAGIFEYEGWNGVLKNWVRILPFILFFGVNNYLFVPRLLFKEKYLYYFLSCILLVVVVVGFFDYFLFDLTRPVRPPFYRMNGMRKDMLLPPNIAFPPRQHHFFNLGLAIVSFLLIGFNTGFKSFIRWNEEHELQADRERQYLHSELAFLKHQISPHFFMNTLNNIHALVDIDADKAKDAIIKLSRLMHYLLYESDVQNVSLKKEIEFIESYIELMRLRYDEDILTIETEYPAVSEAIVVPSFLFLPFIENSFKHGTGLNTHSLIHIRFVHKNGRLVFTVYNNKPDIASVISDASGIGLENVQKRLDLIFKEDYRLEIHSTEDIYEIKLNIPV